MSDTHKTVTCDNCDEEELVDVSDLVDPIEKEVARRANWAVAGDSIYCPHCWDQLNPISI